MLQKENVVFPAVEKNQPILAKLVVGGEIFTKQGAAGFGNDVVFHIGNNLRHLLSNAADDFPSARLQLGQPCFDDVRLLAALEMLAPLANPFLAFEDQVGKLIAHFEGQEFQQAQPEEQIDLNIFVIFGKRQRTLQQLGEQLAEGSAVRSSRGAQLDPRKIGAAGVLTNHVEKIFASRLDELRAQEDVVVDVIHTDRQRPHGDRDVVTLELGPRLFGCTG